MKVDDVDEEQLAFRLQGLGLELQGCIDTGSYAAIYKAKSTGHPKNLQKDEKRFFWDEWIILGL